MSGDSSNPYIEENLQKAQQEFSPDKNKQFEAAHKVIDKEDGGKGDDQKQEKDKKYLVFKWDKSIKEKKDCDTKHMLYLIKLALDKVYTRTTERNTYFKQLGRQDRVMTHLDNEEVLTNLMNHCNEPKDDKAYNQIDGKLLQNTRKKAFINDVLTKLGGITMGWSTKVYAKLTKEVKIDPDAGECRIPNYKWDRLLCDGAILADCSQDEIREIVEERILPKLNNAKLNEHKQKILEWLKNQKMDGKAFTKMEKKVFTAQLRDHCESDTSKNKRLNGPLTKLYNGIKNFDVKDFKKQ